MYDIEKKEILQQYNKYIKQADNTDYNSNGFKFTNITKEMCDSGVTITEALKQFYKAYNSASFVVAHNIDFDYNILKRELTINGLEDNVDWFKLNNLLFCTMKKGVKICKNILQLYFNF